MVSPGEIAQGGSPGGGRLEVSPWIGQGYLKVNPGVAWGWVGDS